MSVAKVIEIHAEGNSIEDAAAAALGEAAKTVDQIRTIYIDGIQAIVENNKITRYRLNTKITFVVKS